MISRVNDFFNENKRAARYITTVAFVLLFLTVTYKLTNSSLAFDETVEYTYSVKWENTMPGMTKVYPMYILIVSTFQPPLYNYLLHFWLQVSEGEFWIRFLGACLAMAGGTGIYLLFKKNTKSTLFTALMVVAYGLVYRQTYYYQEVAEYSLMLSFIPFALYNFSKLCENPTRKNVGGTLAFCILMIYSQYGAAFLATTVLLMSFILVIKNGTKDVKIFTIRWYILSALLTAIPLLLFFTYPQYLRMSTEKVDKVIGPNFTPINIIKNLGHVFTFNMTPFAHDEKLYQVLVVLFILTLTAVFYLIKGSNKTLKIFIVISMISYALYYVAAGLGIYIYMYMYYGDRYALFLTPIWFVTTAWLLLEVMKMLLLNDKLKPAIKRACTVTILVLALVWEIFSGIQLEKNWQKEDFKGVTTAWVNNGGYNKTTIVYRGAAFGFQYYLEHNRAFTEEYLQNVHYLVQQQGTKEYYEGMLTDMLGEKASWSDEIYMVAGHKFADYLNLTDFMQEEGYKFEFVYQSDETELVRWYK